MEDADKCEEHMSSEIKTNTSADLFWFEYTDIADVTNDITPVIMEKQSKVL